MKGPLVPLYRSKPMSDATSDTDGGNTQVSCQP